MPALITSPATRDEAKSLGSTAKRPLASGILIPSAPGGTGPRKVVLVEHPVAQHALTGLRNKHTAGEDFRTHSSQLLFLLALEATRTMPVREDPIEIDSGSFSGKTMAKPVVFLALSPHALGLANRLAEMIPELMVGAISLEQSGDSRRPQPRLHMANSPGLCDARVILFDPIVATGFSASVALGFLRRSGASDLSLLSFVVSTQGLGCVQTTNPDTSVWTAAIDTDWDSKRGPVPGIWNFAGRLYP